MVTHHPDETVDVRVVPNRLLATLDIVPNCVVVGHRHSMPHGARVITMPQVIRHLPIGTLIHLRRTG